MSRLDRIDLAGELAAAQATAARSSKLYNEWLLRLGVPSLTLAMMRGVRAWSFGVVKASPGEDGLYIPGEGLAHMLLPVIEDGGPVDLVVFRPSDPADCRLRTGLGTALGLDIGLERLTWGNPIPVHPTPLAWLKAKMAGICVVNWSSPELYRLRAIPKLACKSEQVTATMRVGLSRDPFLPEIYTVPSGTERLAA